MIQFFAYQGYTTKGKLIKGWIEADSLSSAKEILQKKMNLISIHPKKLRIPKSISQTEKINFTESFARLIKAGIPVYECLEILEEKYEKAKLHPVLTNLSHEIRSGHNLSSSLKKYPGIFDTFYCTMIENAEASGDLSAAFQEILKFLKKQEAFKRKLTAALFYPTILFTFSIIVFCVLLFSVIPSLAPLFAGRSLHPLTSFILNLSHWAIQKKSLFFIAILASISLGITAKFSLGIQKKIKTLFSCLWGIKQIWFRINIMRFFRSMAALMEGGVSLVRALQLSKELVNIPKFRMFLENVEKGILEGASFSKEFENPMIPLIVYRFISIAEEGGNYDQMFYQLSISFEEDLEKDFQKITTILQPAILLFLGGVIGFVLLAVLLPLTDVNSFISNE